ncbi:MAG: hypothetical protein KDD45_00735 [Bdellovibrionales bacterium]|nr:hypothetical protein [Bdellovibrionales bacterium]
MNKIAIHFLLVSTLVFCKSYANAVNEEVVVIKKKSSVELLEDSSEANRINKKGTVTLGLIGIGPNFAPAQSVQAGYFLNRNNLIMLDTKSGNSPAYRSSTEYDWITIKPEVKINQVGVHYKNFPGNSFYIKTGLDYNHVDYTYDFSQSLYRKNLKSSFTGESLIASFVIGNQWQWQSFTLGCDWIGFASPVYSKITSEKAPDSTESYDLDAFKEDKGYYVSSSSVVLLRFYLGASF